MNKFKNYGGISAAALTAILIASGGAGFAESVTLRMVAPASGSGDALKELAAQYEASHDGVSVVIEQYPSGQPYGQALMTQFQSGSGPDVFFGNGGWGVTESILPLAAAGQLADLSGAEWAAGFPDIARGAYWVDGKLYGLPLSMLSVGEVYNAALFESLGLEVPSTFDEVLEICKIAPEKGVSAFLFAGSGPLYLFSILATQEVLVDTPDWGAKRAAGEVTFAETEGWRRAMERILAMRDAGCFQPGYEAANIPQMFGMMVGDKGLMAAAPVTMMGAVKHMRPDIDLRQRPFPGPDAEHTVAIAYYNDALAVNAKGANLDAANAFVAWMAEDAQLQTYAAMAGGTAASAAARLELPEMLAENVDYIADGRVRSIPHLDWQTNGGAATINTTINALMTDQLTIDEALAAFDAYWDQ